MSIYEILYVLNSAKVCCLDNTMGVITPLDSLDCYPREVKMADVTILTKIIPLHA